LNAKLFAFSSKHAKAGGSKASFSASSLDSCGFCKTLGPGFACPCYLIKTQASLAFGSLVSLRLSDWLQISTQIIFAKLESTFSYINLRLFSLFKKATFSLTNLPISS